ncbi:MAG: CoA-binding protein [Prolixibacteraceae bacterium]
MKNKKTLVIGASANPVRYSHMAVHQLRANHHEVIGLAKRKGNVADIEIQTEFPAGEDVHTVTLYVGPQHQPEYYEPLLQLKPKRVIFNPGTENDEFNRRLTAAGIEAIEACTLVMLSTGQY